MTSTAPIVHFELRSSDFDRTAAFYAKALGWQTAQNASNTYMKLDTGDGGPSAGWIRADLSQSPGPLAYLEVDDLATTLGQVEKAGGRVIVPHRPFAGGGEVALFTDPDGNVMGLWARSKKGTPGPAPAAKPEKAAKEPEAAPGAKKPVKAAAPAKPAAAAKPVKAAKPGKR